MPGRKEINCGYSQAGLPRDGKFSIFATLFEDIEKLAFNKDRRGALTGDTINEPYPVRVGDLNNLITAVDNLLGVKFFGIDTTLHVASITSMQSAKDVPSVAQIEEARRRIFIGRERQRRQIVKQQADALESQSPGGDVQMSQGEDNESAHDDDSGLSGTQDEGCDVNVKSNDQAAQSFMLHHDARWSRTEIGRSQSRTRESSQRATPVFQQNRTSGENPDQTTKDLKSPTGMLSGIMESIETQSTGSAGLEQEYSLNCHQTTPENEAYEYDDEMDIDSIDTVRPVEPEPSNPVTASRFSKPAQTTESAQFRARHTPITGSSGQGLSLPSLRPSASEYRRRHQ